MLGKVDSQNGQELLDMNEKGVSIPKKEEKKKPDSSETFTHVLLIFLACVLLGLFLKIFIFNKNTEKNKIFQKFKTAEDMNRNVGDIIVRYVNQHPKARIGLVSGSTPQGLYKYLINKYERGEVSFRDVKFFSIDGYCGLKKDDKNSYYHALNEGFLSKIDAQEQNIFLIKEEGSTILDFLKNAEDYNKLLEENPVDLQILSFGENGHIGFNEPNTNFDSLTQVVKLGEEKRREKIPIFGSFDNTPEYAITQGIKNILQSKEVIVIAKGKEKAKAINELVNGVFTKNSPITALINHNEKVSVYADEAAGSLVKEFQKKF